MMAQAEGSAAVTRVSFKISPGIKGKRPAPSTASGPVKRESHSRPAGLTSSGNAYSRKSPSAGSSVSTKSSRSVEVS